MHFLFEKNVFRIEIENRVFREINRDLIFYQNRTALKSGDFFQTLAAVVQEIQRSRVRAQAVQVLLQRLQLLAQSGPLRREQVVLLHDLTDPLQQLGHTEGGMCV